MDQGVDAESTVQDLELCWFMLRYIRQITSTQDTVALDNLQANR
jgi:hypothetical protein